MLEALPEERGWEVDVVTTVVGQRSVREEGWLESLSYEAYDTRERSSAVNLCLLISEKSA